MEIIKWMEIIKSRRSQFTWWFFVFSVDEMKFYQLIWCWCTCWASAKVIVYEQNLIFGFMENIGGWMIEWQHLRKQQLGRFGSAISWNKKQSKKLVQPFSLYSLNFRHKLLVVMLSIIFFFLENWSILANTLRFLLYVLALLYIQFKIFCSNFTKAM